MFSYLNEKFIQIFLKRQKFESVESEASKSTEVLKGKIGVLKDKVQEAMGEVGKSDFAKKAGMFDI